MAFKPFVNPTHSDWDTKITHATLAINTAKQESTKASPFEIVYGRQPEFPNERQFPWPPEDKESLQHFLRRITRLRKKIQWRLVIQQRQVKSRYDKNRKKSPIFSVGDLVLVARALRFPHLTQKIVA